MRSSFYLPENGDYRAPLVDNRIGDAFRTVQFVRDNFDVLQDLAPGSVRQAVVEGATGLRGQSVELNLPNDIPMTRVHGSDVTIRDQAFQLWDATSGHWEEEIQGGRLKLTLKSSAPASMQNSPIFWLISYGSN